MADGSVFEALGGFVDGGGALIEDFDFIGGDDGDLVAAEEHHVEVGLAKGVGIGGDEGFGAALVDADGDGVFLWRRR